MSGSSMDIMAEAIELAEFVIVFVSRAYRDSYNCKLEGKYAQIRERAGMAQLIYVMMEEDHTPQSVCAYIYMCMYVFCICLHVYVCMHSYISTCVCMYAFVCDSGSWTTACTHTHTHSHVHAHTYTHTHQHSLTHARTHIHTHTHGGLRCVGMARHDDRRLNMVHTHMHTHTRVCVCVCIYIYIYIYIHIYIYI